jgi:serine protease AprX
LALSVAALIALTAPAVFAQETSAAATRKIDRSLRESMKQAGRTRRVIVTVKPGHRAEIRQALEGHGDTITGDVPFVDALAVEVHTEDVAELAKHPWVELISDDAIVRPTGVPGAQAREFSERVREAARKLGSKSAAAATGALVPSTLRETLGLSRVPRDTSPAGQGIGVAIVDSGIAPNGDFGNRITAFYDFTRGGIRTLPFDDYGHGTHIAGLIGSSGLESNAELVGVAPRVSFIGAKVLSRNGEGRSSDVIKALEYLTANRTRLNVRVINLSLGHPIYAPAADDPMVRAVEKASASGIIVVVAAGNFGQDPETGDPGYTGVTSPGNSPSAITSGAVTTQNTVTRQDDRVASYSSRGPTWFDGFAKPDVVAPGSELASDTIVSSYLYKLLANNHKRAASGIDFLQLSGTSMAAAVTSGVVALILEANDRLRFDGARPLTPNTVKGILEFTAIPVAHADHLTEGAGEINAAGAVALASAIDTSVRAGNWWLRAGISASTSIDGVRYDWSKTIIWGDDALTGGLIFYNDRGWAISAAWGDDNIVWGTHALVLDDNIVWGTATVWASNIVWPDRVLGQITDDNIIWGTDDNVVWGTWDGDNIVWGTWDLDNIVWGTDDNIVWGTDDNIVWGTALGWGGIF